MTDTPPVGIFPDMSEADYRSDARYVNQSKLKPFADDFSPKKAKHMADAVKKSKAMDAGTILDHAILRPNDPLPYVVMPEELAILNQNKKEVQTWKKSQTKIITKPEVLKELRDCRDAVWTNPAARNYLINSAVQVPGFALHEATGLFIKGLVDVWPEPGMDALIDCKKTADVRTHKFLDQADKLHYDMQAAFYMYIWNAWGVPITKWVWVVYEAEPPHCVRVIECPERMLTVGRWKMEKCLRIWADCVESGDWPDYPARVEKPELPYYYGGKYAEALREY